MATNNKLLQTLQDYQVGIDLNSAKIKCAYEAKNDDGYAYIVDGGVRFFHEIVASGDKEFTKTPTSNLIKNTYNVAVDSLLLRMRHTDMQPVYQRGLVWDIETKQNLIDALVQGGSIGAITFAKNGYSSGNIYEILDGKQRLTTIAEFVADGFTYQGIYFSELSPKAQSDFFNTSVSVIDVSFSNNNEKIEYFIELNSAGVKVSQEFLEGLKTLIK